MFKIAFYSIFVINSDGDLSKHWFVHFLSFLVPPIKFTPKATVQSCCQDENVPDYCMGLCTPADIFSSRSSRVTACTQYKSVIAECVMKKEQIRTLELKSKAQFISNRRKIVFLL